MKTFILLLLISFPLFSFSQLAIDTSLVKGAKVEYLNDSSFFEKEDNLLPIVKSDNFLEIRANVFYAPTGGFETVVLTWNNNVWNAHSIRKPYKCMYDSTCWQYYKLTPKGSFDEIVRELDSLHLFRIKHYRQLERKKYIYDGAMFSIKYKVGSKYEKLVFDNPCTFKRIYADVKEYDAYCSITATLFNGFTKSPIIKKE